MSEMIVQEQGGSLAQKLGYSEKQLDLVRRTVAKNATDDELELFFYRCRELKLNPLMPGQIYFMKFGSAPGAIVVGIDGFRLRAHRTGKLNGIKRGKITDDNGNLIGAWADVYHKDCDHPFHEEVPLHEYADPRKPIWKNMPETMIKKIAEVAALRMAFPDELGGIYTNEEFDKAEKVIPNEQNGPRIDQKPKIVPEPQIVSDRPTEKQIKRLFAIAATAQVSLPELKTMMKEFYGLESTKDLNKVQYDELCKELESIDRKPSVPAPVEEPGEWVDSQESAT